MNLIQFNIQGALSGTNQFDPNAPGVVRTVQDGRIVFMTAPPLTFGRFDVAALLGFDNRPMVVFYRAISNTAGPVTGSAGIAGPTAPAGAVARGTQLALLIAGSGLSQNPIIIPSQHLLQVAADSPPITLFLMVDQWRSGDIVTELVRGDLTP